MSSTAAAETSPFPGVSGVYIAHHRWLDNEYGPGQLHKVGHTGDLGSRLNDSAYVTCFPDAWKYIATFEVASKEEAFLLETAVLHCCRHRRLGPRELVRLPAGELAGLAAALARELGIAATRRDWPEYAAGGRARARDGPRASGPAEPAAWPASKAAVERFTVGPALAAEALASALAAEALAPARAAAPAGEPAAPAGEPAADLAELVDDILSWDFSGVALPVPARPPQAPEPAAPAAPAADEKGEDLAVGEVDDAALEQELDGACPSPYDLGGARAPAPFAPREYQREAIARCAEDLRANGRAILQMACRCGKTPVAYGVLREFAESGRALFLVPGLSLLRQTAQKLASYGYAEPILLVGSDPREVPLLDGRALTMTTDPAAIRAFVAGEGRRLVISTYQSSPLMAAAPADAFELTVFDECHRVCGGAAPRPFNHAILQPRAGARLFMTATPAYDAAGKAAITMKDRERFGGVAYRYHLRQGIAAGYVNDFRLELVAAPAGARDDPEAALPAQLLAAMSKVDKLLVFCRDIRHAARLCGALREAALPAGVAPFECLAAHSRMGPGGAAGALRRFAAPGARAVLFNCRMFQEGVEIPALNGVFFAAPRHSPRDIIQSVCRPLNAAAGKPPSVIFLPVLCDPARPPEDPANLRRFASVVPFVDALLDEDPRLYEHLLDPAGSPYPVEVLGAHTLALATPRARRALLAAVRRAVRYGASAAARPAERLLRVENVPWARAFAEVRRIVETCGRYPKTTDAWVVGEAKVCLHRFYRWAADEYRAARAGRPSKLEPWQVHELAALPGWEPYGVEGPYPWRPCLDFLEGWLAAHGGVPPMVEINVGGYVGLEASMMERLSGALTCVNQGDGKARKGKAPNSGFTVSPEKQADLDALCARHGLRWRKERDASGALAKGGAPTFIQEAYARFKEEYRARGAESGYIREWFSDYPQKHRRQENLAVQAAGSAPPRWRAGRRKKTAEDDAEAGDAA